MAPVWQCLKIYIERSTRVNSKKKKIEGAYWSLLANAFYKTKKKCKKNYTIGTHIKEFKLKYPES